MRLACFKGGIWLDISAIACIKGGIPHINHAIPYRNTKHVIPYINQQISYINSKYTSTPTPQHRHKRSGRRVGGHCTCLGQELGCGLVKPAFLALSQKCGKRVKIAWPMCQYCLTGNTHLNRKLKQQCGPIFGRAAQNKIGGKNKKKDVSSACSHVPPAVSRSASLQIAQPL